MLMRQLACFCVLLGCSTVVLAQDMFIYPKNDQNAEQQQKTTLNVTYGLKTRQASILRIHQQCKQLRSIPVPMVQLLAVPSVALRLELSSAIPTTPRRARESEWPSVPCVGAIEIEMHSRSRTLMSSSKQPAWRSCRIITIVPSRAAWKPATTASVRRLK